MWRLFSKRMSAVAVVALTAALAVSADAVAAEHDMVQCFPNATVQCYPAGEACKFFELRVDLAGGDKRVPPLDSNPVKMISAGVGFQVTFTNLSNNKMIVLPANGAVMQTVKNADGSQTVTATGHNVLILFPTDEPAGPSTTLHVGRVVYTVDDATGKFTVTSTSGTEKDICAALS
jgi:hypothetical protein